MWQPIKQGLQKLVQALKWLWQQIKRISKWIWEHTLGLIIRSIQKAAEERKFLTMLSQISVEAFQKEDKQRRSDWLEQAEELLDRGGGYGYQSHRRSCLLKLKQANMCANGSGASFYTSQGIDQFGPNCGDITMFYAKGHSPFCLRMEYIVKEGFTIEIGGITYTYQAGEDALITKLPNGDPPERIPMKDVVQWKDVYSVYSKRKPEEQKERIVVLTDANSRQYLLFDIHHKDRDDEQVLIGPEGKIASGGEPQKIIGNDIIHTVFF